MRNGLVLNDLRNNLEKIANRVVLNRKVRKPESVLSHFNFIVFCRFQYIFDMYRGLLGSQPIM